MYKESGLKHCNEDMVKRVYKSLQRTKNINNNGDFIIIVTGWKSGSGYTNTLRIINALKTDEGPILGALHWAGCQKRLQ